MSIWHEAKQDCFVIHVEEIELNEEIIDRVCQILTVAFLNKQFNIVFNLNGCRMIDSFFIGLIIQTYRELHELGGNLRCAGANENIRHAFEIIRLDRVVDICETVEDAIELFKNENAASV